jgi:VanZ family protein
MAAGSIKKAAERWGPAILMMGLIFMFSSIHMQESLPPAWPPKLTPVLLFRKGAHLLGYALLALALNHGFRIKGWKGAAVTLGCVLVYALSDEFHQSFVPGRDASLIDVGIDLLGGGSGLVIACILGKLVDESAIHRKH